jgi:hypothetical protein
LIHKALIDLAALGHFSRREKNAVAPGGRRMLWLVDSG